MDHPDFGQAFACRRCAVDSVQIQERNLRYARLPQSVPPKTFATFEVSEHNAEAYHSALDFAASRTVNTLLVLSGGNGTGKSHLAEAVGRCVIANGYRARFAFVPDLVAELRAGSAPEARVDYDRIMASLQEADVLILDDVTDRRVTPFALDAMERIVDERTRNRRAMLLTTNLDVQRMGEVWGGRVADRLWGVGTDASRVVLLSGASYRTGQTWGRL